ncbi:serine/threonine-protein kinase [Bacteroides sp.]|uniref:serine/threonine-protein kinase n=1 Tax=Bacteroides sp. TaxID=29523 RepID=UPI00258DC337|nr:serine/threonine-protein kinase [Bacteroides sp.]
MVDVEQLAKDGKLFDGRYKLLKTLSTDGGTADVWLAIDINTIDNPDLLGEEAENFSPEESGMMVAIKIYRPKNALDIEGEQRFRDEYKIVHNCRHTNLLQPTNFSICDDTPYLELPYCKNGSSEMLIGKAIEKKDLWKFIFDVSSGLSYLHACTPQIIHQDIKPANVLIDDYNNYAITDFGISSQRGGKHGFYFDEDNSGTMAYMAPERFSENYRPTAESDIWAFGATLYEILTGEVPFKEEGGKNQLEKNMKLKSMGSNIPKEIQKLINSCLSLNPQERPTANQIIKLSEKHLNTSNSIIKYASAVILFALITWGIYSFLSPKPPVISMEESYNKALVMLNSNNPHDVKQAVNIMDSLSIKNYAPAMYELARTYGWYSDSLLLKRKEILGIDYYDDKEHYGLPKLDKYNDKARDLYSKILELNDSTTAIIKANAAYRMATYSANETTGIYGQNFKKAKEYLLDAKKYAMEAKDDSLLMSINNAISIIDKRIK